MQHLFLAELKRTWIEFRRYPMEALATIVATTFIFYGLFLSARFIAGGSLSSNSDRLDTVVVGYVLWSLVLSVINDIAAGLQVEAQTGTLEQVMLSSFGAPIVFLVRAMTSLVSRLALILGLLLIIIVITGVHLHFSPMLWIPLLSLLISAYGLAFFSGALALVFKRVQNLLGLLQFSFLFLLAVPSQTWTQPLQKFALVLPMTPGADGIRQLMVHNQNLAGWQIVVALLNGVFYFALGWLVFQWAERQAKHRGILSSY
jgi:ABC-2 type transport system permease protein